MFRKATLVVVLCALFVPAGLVYAGDLTADDIIAKNVEARGGLDALHAVKSAVITGTMAMMGMEAPFSMTFMRPMKVRMEFTVQGVTGIRAYDGETGWEVMPFMGKKEPAKVSEDDLKDLEDQADFDGPFVNYKDKGHTVELEGKVEEDGTEAYKIKLTKKNGDVEYHYFDTDSCLEFKVEGKRDIRGTETEYATVVGDYKKVGAILLPHSMESSFGENFTQTITLTDVKLNADVSPGTFAMPEAKVEKTNDAGD